MKILEFSNQSLMLMATQSALLKNNAIAGSVNNITVDDNNGFAQNDFVLLGEIGQAKSEIFKVNAAVATGTGIQADSLTFPHSVGTPLYNIPYNQVKFYHSDTLTGTKTFLAIVDIQADKETTIYKDATNSTGYAFFTLYNSETSVESGYSAGFSYGNISYGSRIKIREFVKEFFQKPLSETQFTMLCDSIEAEIFAIKKWKFREKIFTFNSVADQQKYSLLTIGATDIGQLVYATYDGHPVSTIDIKQHKILNWQSTNSSGIPVAVCEIDRELYFTPKPNAIASIELIYYKNSSGFADETTESEVQLPMAIAYRILQDLWAPFDQKKSAYYRTRFLETIDVMERNDKKQVSKFPTLTESGVANATFLNSIDNIQIDV